MAFIKEARGRERRGRGVKQSIKSPTPPSLVSLEVAHCLVIRKTAVSYVRLAFEEGMCFFFFWGAWGGGLRQGFSV